MNLESFLDELRAAREAGVVFRIVDERGSIRADWGSRQRLCPLDVVYVRRGGWWGENGRCSIRPIVFAADNRTGADPDLRARLLEACGLAEQAPTS